MYTHIIYKLTFPNNKIYIGQTSLDFNIRLNCHKSSAYNSNLNRYIHNAIKKYGWDNIVKEIICTVSSEFSDDAEKYFINKYSCNDIRFGYNLTGGGKQNYKMSDNLVKISNITKVNTKETNKKISISMRGRKQSNEHIENASKTRYKSINMYDKSNNFIKTFESTVQASAELNIFTQAICGVLKNRRKTTNGYIFSYTK